MRKPAALAILALVAYASPLAAATVLEGAQPFTHDYCRGHRPDKDGPLILPSSAMDDDMSPGGYMLAHDKRWDAVGCHVKPRKSSQGKAPSIPQK